MVQSKQRQKMRQKRKMDKDANKALTEQSLNDLKAIKRTKERERKAKYRVNKKTVSTPTQMDDINSPSHSAYLTKASYEKAIARVKRCLPGSPRKKRAVIKHLTYEQIKVKPFFNKKSKTASTSISKETKTSIIAFYENDSISRQAPGKRDVVTTRDKEGKHKMQKRHLTMGVLEAYTLWKEENPDVKCGKSTFAKLRPPNVLFTSELSRNVCVCINHENLILLFERLHKYDSKFPLYSSNLPLSWVCTEHTHECWFNSCQKCKDGEIFMSVYPPPQQASDNEDDDLNVAWYQWENILDHVTFQEGAVLEGGKYFYHFQVHIPKTYN